jgi:hypothetical protein
MACAVMMSRRSTIGTEQQEQQALAEKCAVDFLVDPPATHTTST